MNDVIFMVSECRKIIHTGNHGCYGLEIIGIFLIFRGVGAVSFREGTG